MILFFSRGRGHGHAIPDMAIATELHAARPDVDIRFVSYATGASTLESSDWDVVNLDLPENNPFLSTLYKAQSLIACLKPALIIAHEEFAAMAAARICGVRSIFISAWLPQPGSLQADCLADANEVIVLGDPGIFPVPHPQMPQPHYVGEIVRKMVYGPGDRLRARNELGIEASATTIMVASGGWATEARAPVAEVVLDAFRMLSNKPKVLLWVAGRDRDAIGALSRAIEEVRVFDFYSPIERLMAASDLLITKGTRGLTLEASRLGLPSISLSHGLNPVDDLLIPKIHSNLALNAKAVDAMVLLNAIVRQIGQPAAVVRIHADGLCAVTAMIDRNLIQP